MMRPYPRAFIAGSDGFGEEEWRRHVHLERPSPLVGRELGKARRSRERRVVHEDVDAAEALSVAATISSGTPVGGDVAGHRERALAERSRHRLGAARVAHVDGDGGAALVQPLRDRAAKTARRARDDRDAPREIQRANRRRARPAGCRHSGRTIISTAEPDSTSPTTRSNSARGRCRTISSSPASSHTP